MAETSLPTSNFYANNPDLLAINDWAAKNANNDSVKGLANDLFYNFASASLQTRSDVDYAKQMGAEALRYQQGQQDISSAADLRRLAAEGALVEGLTAQQIKGQKDLEGIRGFTERYGADRSVDEVKERGLADRKVAETQARASNYGYDSQERQIGLTGEQERLSEQQRTTEQLRLRADARGAIRSAGKTFYG